MERVDIERMVERGTTAERVLAMSWLDADDYRSVKQNAAQRKTLIESAINEIQGQAKKMAEVDRFLKSSNGELLLMAGEMTAQEKRTVRAILDGLARKIEHI